MCKVSLISQRTEDQGGYQLLIRSSKLSTNVYDSRVTACVSVSRRGVDICSVSQTGPECEDVIATGRVGEIEQQAIQKALEKVDLIRMAFAGMLPS